MADGGPAPEDFPCYKRVRTRDLIPYARNARTHSDAQVAQIAASIREFGFTNPVSPTATTASLPATVVCWRRVSSVWPKCR